MIQVQSALEANGRMDSRQMVKLENKKKSRTFIANLLRKGKNIAAAD